jgi:flagellar hook assembly protein FlgD
LIYDLTGRRVATLLDGPAAAGAQAIDWDGRDDAGRQLASGVYLLRFAAAETCEQGKLVLLK